MPQPPVHATAEVIAARALVFHATGTTTEQTLQSVSSHAIATTLMACSACASPRSREVLHLR